MKRIPLAAWALPALAVARLFPDDGIGLYVRLAAATAILLLPGVAVARALGVPGVSPVLAWTLACLTFALVVTFALDLSLDATLVLLAGVTVGAGIVALRRPSELRPPGSVGVAAAGVVFGMLLWHVAGRLGGDALFHLARVRKLLAFDSLSLDTVNEFADGGLHPGYALPLWHGFVALVGRLAGVDPADVLLHEASVLAPLALVVTYEAGLALFRSVSPALAVVAAQVAIVALAPGHGGSYTALALPATASRQLLVPAVLALAFAALADRSWALLASLGAAALALAVVHPTYALFVAFPLAGFLAVRTLVAREDARPIAAVLAAIALPSAAFFAWLLPLVRDTASHDPGSGEVRRALDRYASDLDVASTTSYRLAADVLPRTGAVAVAALLLIPLAAFAARRRWAAFVLGGSLAVAALMLIPPLFTALADLVSLSQARRAAGFLPFAFAFAGGLAVLSHALDRLVLPLAFAAGVVLQLAYPGSFALDPGRGGPGVVTWLAVAGGAAAVAGAYVLRRREPAEARGALVAAAAALFVLPVAVHGFWNWSPSRAPDGAELTPGLVAALRDDVARGDVVFSDLETSYRIAAAAPVYVAAAPPAHVADTKDNRPYERRRDVLAFFERGRRDVPERYGADWIVVDRSRFPDVTLSLRRAYSDERYVLYQR